MKLFNYDFKIKKQHAYSLLSTIFLTLHTSAQAQIINDPIAHQLQISSQDLVEWADVGFATKLNTNITNSDYYYLRKNSTSFSIGSKSALQMNKIFYENTDYSTLLNLSKNPFDVNCPSILTSGDTSDISMAKTSSRPLGCFYKLRYLEDPSAKEIALDVLTMLRNPVKGIQNVIQEVDCNVSRKKERRDTLVGHLYFGVDTENFTWSLAPKKIDIVSDVIESKNYYNDFPWSDSKLKSPCKNNVSTTDILNDDLDESCRGNNGNLLSTISSPIAYNDEKHLGIEYKSIDINLSFDLNAYFYCDTEVDDVSDGERDGCSEVLDVLASNGLLELMSETDPSVLDLPSNHDYQGTFKIYKYSTTAKIDGMELKGMSLWQLKDDLIVNKAIHAQMMKYVGENLNFNTFNNGVENIIDIFNNSYKNCGLTYARKKTTREGDGFYSRILAINFEHLKDDVFPVAMASNINQTANFFGKLTILGYLQKLDSFLSTIVTHFSSVGRSFKEIEKFINPPSFSGFSTQVSRKHSKFKDRLAAVSTIPMSNKIVLSHQVSIPEVSSSIITSGCFKAAPASVPSSTDDFQSYLSGISNTPGEMRTGISRQSVSLAANQILASVSYCGKDFSKTPTALLCSDPACMTSASGSSMPVGASSVPSGIFNFKINSINAFPDFSWIADGGGFGVLSPVLDGDWYLEKLPNSGAFKFVNPTDGAINIHFELMDPSKTRIILWGDIKFDMKVISEIGFLKCAHHFLRPKDIEITNFTMSSVGGSAQEEISSSSLESSIKDMLLYYLKESFLVSVPVSTVQFVNSSMTASNDFLVLFQAGTIPSRVPGECPDSDDIPPATYTPNDVPTPELDIPNDSSVETGGGSGLN